MAWLKRSMSQRSPWYTYSDDLACSSSHPCGLILMELAKDVDRYFRLGTTEFVPQKSMIKANFGTTQAVKDRRRVMNQDGS